MKAIQKIMRGGKIVCVLIFLVSLENNLLSQNLENIGTEKPIKLHGGLNLGTVFYSSDNSPERQAPFYWTIGGSAILDIYGVSLPFTLNYSKSNAAFSQPFVRFGLSPEYKWVKVHLGYRSLSFNSFVFSGQPMYGVGLELTPKKLRFGIMYGRLSEADFIDSTRAQFLQQGSTFERKGLAVKLGVGSNKNFVDFSFLKAKDDPNSIAYFSRTSQSLPAENAVIGLSSRFQFGAHIAWSLEIAGSVYNRDVSSPELTSLIDSQTVVKYQSGINAVEKIIPLLTSSQFVTAGETGLSFQFKPFSVAFKYRRVDPEYKSMGIFFIQNDLEQYTVNPNLRLFGNKVLLNSSVGYQRNNLDGKRLYRSERFIGSGNLSFTPSAKWSLGFNYGNFGVTQQKQYVDGLYRDSLALRQVNEQYGVTSAHNFLNLQHPQTLVFSINLQNTTDYRDITTNKLNANSWFANVSHSIFFVASGLSLQTSLLANSNTFSEIISDKFYSLQLNASKTAFEQKLSIQGGGGYSLRQSNGQNTPSISLRAGATLTLAQRHNFNTLFQWVKTSLVNVASGGELYGSVGYGYSF